MNWERVMERLDREIENIEMSSRDGDGVVVTKAGDDDWVSTTSEWEEAKEEVQDVLDRYGNISYQVQEVPHGTENERQIFVATVYYIGESNN